MKKLSIIALAASLLFLAACNGGDPVEPDNVTDPPAVADPVVRTDSSLIIGSSGDAAFRHQDVVAATDDFEAVYNPYGSLEELLEAFTSGAVDLLLVSPQIAAELYRGGFDVQVVAVLTPSDTQVTEILESMECLIGTSAYLDSDSSQVAAYLDAYAAAVEEHNASEDVTEEDKLFLATGYDMMDLVQENLEAQYAANSDLDHSVPDGNFFRLDP